MMKSDGGVELIKIHSTATASSCNSTPKYYDYEVDDDVEDESEEEVESAVSESELPDKVISEEWGDIVNYNNGNRKMGAYTSSEGTGLRRLRNLFVRSKNKRPWEDIMQMIKSNSSRIPL